MPLHPANLWISKKVENHIAAVSLHLTHYNFARIHQTFRIRPAMSASICDYAREVSDLVKMFAEWGARECQKKTANRLARIQGLPIFLMGNEGPEILTAIWSVEKFAENHSPMTFAVETRPPGRIIVTRTWTRTFVFPQRPQDSFPQVSFARKPAASPLRL